MSPADEKGVVIMLSSPSDEETILSASSNAWSLLNLRNHVVGHNTNKLVPSLDMETLPSISV
jgi:hypothetical protein